MMLEWLFRAIGFGLCHQLPERSFFAGGYQVPVCARDTGIYLGFALGLLALSFLARGSRPSELPRWPVLVLIGLGVAAMGFDGVTSYAGMRTTTNDIRLITGLLTGWGLSALTFPMINAQLWSRPGEARVPDGGAQVALWLGMLGAAFALSKWVLPFTGVLFPILVSIAILITFEAINMVFVALVPAFERRYERLAAAWLPLLLALALTFVELVATGWLRTFAERSLL